MRPIDRGLAKAFVLRILVEGPMHGYGIMKRVREITGFVPSPGHIYLLLRKLEREGLVEVSLSYIGGRRVKIYRLSDRGREFLEDNKDLLKQFDVYVERFRKAREIELHKLFKTIHSIFESLDRIPSDKMEAIKEAVNDFIKRVNRIVGE
ncbi:MAG: PadR family transcriptional regulator [Ignisphaera sp.]|uniref:PadR family transcriptional regulator n=1 Tax=Ignisphaera aggregans TaxID=334771 RepID=A0A7J3JNX2_9CREN